MKWNEDTYGISCFKAWSQHNLVHPATTKNHQASQPAQSLQPATSYWNPAIAEAVQSRKISLVVSLVNHLKGWNCRLIQRSWSQDTMNIWLVVLTCFNRLEKYEFVNGKDDIPYIVENKSHVWKHQPDMVDLWLAHEPLQCQPSLLRHMRLLAPTFTPIYFCSKRGKKAAKKRSCHGCASCLNKPVWTLKTHKITGLVKV